MIAYSENKSQFSFQQDLPFPSEPLAYLDPGSKGFFSTLVQVNPDKKVGQSFPMRRLMEVLTYMDPKKDSWISQNQFTRPNRLLMNLWRINSCFSDLDTYLVPGMQGRGPEWQTQFLLDQCQERNIPSPSLVVFSGQGLHAKWILENPIPGKKTLPRWEALQRCFLGALKDFGADQNSIDGSRVLRLERTVNTKSGEFVRVLHPVGAEPIAWNFETLAKEVFPFTREELKVAKEEREAAKITKAEKVARAKDIFKEYNLHSLYWGRLNDLRLLAHLRGWDRGNPDGMRDPFVFLGTVFASFLVTGHQLYLEAAALAREFAPHWSQNKLREKVGSYFKRAEEGRKAKYSNQRIVEMVGITPTEERQMATLMSKAEARRRDRERHEAERRAAGIVDRDKQAEERRQKAIELRGKGLSFKQIAIELGVTRRHVIRILGVVT